MIRLVESQLRTATAILGGGGAGECQRLNVLCIGAHVEDIPVGMGGTVHRFRSEWQITWLVLSSDGNTDQRRDSSVPAMLGVSQTDVAEQPIGEFAGRRQAVLEEMLPYRGKFDLVLAPSPHDPVEDHHVAAAEAFRVFRDRLMYFSVSKQEGAAKRSNLFYRLAENDVSAKVRAVDALRAAHAGGRELCSPATEDEMRAALLSHRDRGEGYLEGFEVAAYVVQ